MDFSNVLFVFLLVLYLYIANWIVQGVLSRAEGWLNYLRTKKFLALGLTILVFFVSVSGMLYNIIRETIPFYCTRKGCIFIHPQSGQQFSLEGFLIGALYMIGAASLIFLMKMFPRASASSIVPITIGCLAAFILSFSLITKFYWIKNKWYPYRLLL